MNCVFLPFRTQIKKNGHFRKQCNAFFIDLVSTICFRDNSPPNKAIVRHLLSFLMVEAGSVPIVRGWRKGWNGLLLFGLGRSCPNIYLNIIFSFIRLWSAVFDQGSVSVWWRCGQKPCSTVCCAQTAAEVQVRVRSSSCLWSHDCISVLFLDSFSFLTF